MALFTIEKQQIPAILLKDRFGTNPFSVLRADTADWIKQKRQWEYILQDRKNNVRDTVAKGNTPYINNFEKEDFKGAKSPNAGMISTFDPFLCELMVKWFSEEGDLIVDPFAGGVVRGAVSCILKRAYIGIDISEKQVEHNRKQWQDIKGRYDISKELDPTYYIGDSKECMPELMTGSVDMILTCPPYYNLERYTDKQADLSNMGSYAEFYSLYKYILEECARALKPGGYAVIVVEEIRDKDGSFYGFVPDTIRACMNAGLQYYNEMILVNPIAILGIRSTKYFVASRKVGRHHQNVLVFKKGEQ